MGFNAVETQNRDSEEPPKDQRDWLTKVPKRPLRDSFLSYITSIFSKIPSPAQIHREVACLI